MRVACCAVCVVSRMRASCMLGVVLLVVRCVRCLWFVVCVCCVLFVRSVLCVVFRGWAVGVSCLRVVCELAVFEVFRLLVVV